MKLVSKFNKKSEAQKLNAGHVCDDVVKALNLRLQTASEEDSCSPLIFTEVRKFESMNGFINVFLQSEQFMDRVHVQKFKKQISNKDSLLNQKEASEESQFSIKPIGYLESCFREKFGTPR
jgi:hypothetical protein